MERRAGKLGQFAVLYHNADYEGPENELPFQAIVVIFSVKWLSGWWPRQRLRVLTLAVEYCQAELVTNVPRTVFVPARK